MLCDGPPSLHGGCITGGFGEGLVPLWTGLDGAGLEPLPPELGLGLEVFPESMLRIAEGRLVGDRSM